jgi:COMM domain containing 7
MSLITHQFSIYYFCFIYYSAVKAGYNTVAVEEYCVSNGIASQLSGVISNRWTERRREITSSLIGRIISANKLVDMDWSFGVTVASSDMDQVGKTYIQLKLTTEEGNYARQVHFVELSVDQFYQFLGALESCKKYLVYLSASKES